MAALRLTPRAAPIPEQPGDASPQQQQRCGLRRRRRRERREVERHIETRGCRPGPGAQDALVVARHHLHLVTPWCERTGERPDGRASPTLLDEGRQLTACDALPQEYVPRRITEPGGRLTDEGRLQ